MNMGPRSPRELPGAALAMGRYLSILFLVIVGSALLLKVTNERGAVAPPTHSGSTRAMGPSEVEVRPRDAAAPLAPVGARRARATPSAAGLLEGHGLRAGDAPLLVEDPVPADGLERAPVSGRRCLLVRLVDRSGAPWPDWIESVREPRDFSASSTRRATVLARGVQDGPLLSARRVEPGLFVFDTGPLDTIEVISFGGDATKGFFAPTRQTVELDRGSAVTELCLGA